MCICVCICVYILTYGCKYINKDKFLTVQLLGQNSCLFYSTDIAKLSFKNLAEIYHISIFSHHCQIQILWSSFFPTEMINGFCCFNLHRFNYEWASLSIFFLWNDYACLLHFILKDKRFFYTKENGLLLFVFSLCSHFSL